MAEWAKQGEGKLDSRNVGAMRVDHSNVHQPHEPITTRLRVGCHVCGTHFLVPVEKVEGQRFRVNCRQCDSIIVARFENGSLTILSDVSTDPALMNSDVQIGSNDLDAEDQPTVDGAAVGEGWYVGMSGRPHGPLTIEDVENLYNLGKISPKTYAWCDGMSTWQRLGDIPELEPILLGEQLTNIFRRKGPPPADEMPPHDEIDQSALDALSYNGSPSRDVSFTDARSLSEKISALSHDISLSEAGASEAGASVSDAGNSDAGDQIWNVAESWNDAGVARVPTTELSEDGRALTPAFQEVEEHHTPSTGSVREPQRWRRRTELAWGQTPGRVLPEEAVSISVRTEAEDLPSQSGSWTKSDAGAVHQQFDEGVLQQTPAVSSRGGRRNRTMALTSGNGAFTAGNGGQVTPEYGTTGEPHALQPRASVPVRPTAAYPSGAKFPSGSKLAPDVLQLIPRKVSLSPQQLAVSQEVSFAPPLPDQNLPVGAARPSLLLTPKRRSWQLGRLLGVIGVMVTLLGVAGGLSMHLLSSPAPEPKEGDAKKGSDDTTELVLQNQKSAAIAEPGMSDRRRIAPAQPPQRAAENRDNYKQPKEISGRHSTKPQAKKAATAAARKPSKAASSSKQRVAEQRTRSHRKSRVATKARRRTTRQPRRTEQRNVRPSRAQTLDPSTVVDVGGDEAAVARSADADAILAAGTSRKDRPKRGRSEAAAREPDMPTTLTRRQVRDAMAPLLPTIRSCFEKFGNSGKLELKMVVQPYGRAVGTVVGALVGTPTANCVLEAIPRLKFPVFAGPPISFVYPYTLK